MDTNSTKQHQNTNAQASRLPAGSTLEIAPGIHVPHPHAEVNLAGQGDPRAAADTAAVTETMSTAKPSPSGDAAGATAPFTNHATKPLSNEARVSSPAVPVVTAKS